ncbi:MAG TPA: ATP-dependent protease ATPase subunit HslU [Gemmatimonadaceae bacterium]|nr:ATP-dependent protease ATPase subunit HslU [Gemmatimonadaceae bacterium]
MPSNRTQQVVARLADLTPRQIVAELDRYIVGQGDAKKAVAIALRNRWRRQRAPDAIRDEISPNNIILIGPTGVGKTEIARRLAKLAGAPFVKVEASKFTEVGYVGRDVEAMVRDLVESAIDMVRTERESEVEDLAHEKVDERLLDLLLPMPADAKPAAPTHVPAAAAAGQGGQAGVFVVGADGSVQQEATDHNAALDRYKRTREKLKQLLIDGQLESREVEVEVTQHGPMFDMMVPQGAPEGMENFTEMLQDMLPKRKKRRTVKVSEARRILLEQEFEKLIDLEDVTSDALERVEKLGIIFLDEIDKIAGARGEHAGGPDVSREGVQRDLLPIVEGSNVQTKYGLVKTDHVLFIAAGAFHVSKPSDLIPELQGRFPIRVELKPLTEGDFVRIMTEPENALTKQYSALVEAEGAKLNFTPDGIAEIARIATSVTGRMENIGARRLHTVMTTLLEDVLYDLPDRGTDAIMVDRTVVNDRLRPVMEDEDLRRYIL